MENPEPLPAETVTEKNVGVPDKLTDDHCEDVDEWFGAAIHLYAIREVLANEFDSHNKESMQEVFIEYQRLREALHLTEAVRIDVGDERLTEALALFNSAWNSLVSAFQLTRQMDEIGAGSLMRLALETACSGFAILTSEVHYERYLAYKFKATKCISVAARAVPLVGEMYGALSKLMAHPHRAVHGPFFQRWSPVELSRVLTKGDVFYVPGEKGFRLLLTQLSLVVCLTTRLLELGFYADGQTRTVLREVMECRCYTEDVDEQVTKLHREFVDGAADAKATMEGRNAEQGPRRAGGVSPHNSGDAIDNIGMPPNCWTLS